MSSGLFVYANPARVRWGESSLAELAGELEGLGVERPALVSTRSVLANPRLAGALEGALGGRALAARVSVGQHAPLADVEGAAAALLEGSADGVVSLGGGSAVDAAKIAAARAGSSLGKAGPLPHVALPTTLSAAELAAGAGVTDASGRKVGLRDQSRVPDAVLYDGALALETPLALWLSTGIRALDHAVEGYLGEGEHPLSDVLALEAVGRLMEGLPRARVEPASAAVRADNQVAAWLSYALPGASAGGLSHVMGKEIGARHGIPHGVTSCLLLPHVMRHRALRQPERMSRLALATGGGQDPAGAAREVEALVSSLGLPRHISEFGIGEPELREAAQALAGRFPGFDLMAIYLAAL